MLPEAEPQPSFTWGTGSDGQGQTLDLGQKDPQEPAHSSACLELKPLCLQVPEGWSAHLPGLLVVHKCCPARSGRGLSSYPEHMAGNGDTGSGGFWGDQGLATCPQLLLYACGQNSPEYVKMMSACHQRAADALVAGAIRNGGLYVKLGQGLCSFNHLLPPEYIQTLRVLEDKALTRGFREVSSTDGEEERGGHLGSPGIDSMYTLPGGRAVP